MSRHDDFLNYVEKYVKDNPDVAAYVSDFVGRGLVKALSISMERAADMESALAIAIAKRWPDREKIILSKLEKWNGKSALRWDDTISSLKEKK